MAFRLGPLYCTTLPGGVVRVRFASNVEFPRSKTQFSFLEIDCKATSLLLKFLEIFRSMKKKFKKVLHLMAYSAPYYTIIAYKLFIVRLYQ